MLALVLSLAVSGAPRLDIPLAPVSVEKEGEQLVVLSVSDEDRVEAPTPSFVEHPRALSEARTARLMRVKNVREAAGKT